MACALLAAVTASLLALGAASGQAWASAAIYVALLGWIGSAVVAHVHHIGIRVLLTNVRGEDDETCPGAILFPPLTWATVAVYEAAVILGAWDSCVRSSGLSKSLRSSALFRSLLCCSI